LVDEYDLGASAGGPVEERREECMGFLAEVGGAEREVFEARVVVDDKVGCLDGEPVEVRVIEGVSGSGVEARDQQTEESEREPQEGVADMFAEGLKPSICHVMADLKAKERRRHRRGVGENPRPKERGPSCRQRLRHASPGFSFMAIQGILEIREERE